jgi:hypothetical protein
MHELREFGRALFRHGTRGALGDAERLRQLRGIVQRARQEVERLDAGEARAAGGSSTDTTII